MAEKADYIVVRTAAGMAYGTALLSEAALSQLLDHPETLLWRHLDRPVKLSHETLLVEAELPLVGGLVRAAYKQFRPRGWWKAISGAFARAERCGDGPLAERVWPSASPRRVPWRFANPAAGRRPAPITWQPNGFRARTCTCSAGGSPGSPLSDDCDWPPAVAESTGRLLGRMHAAGVVHRDLKAANFVAVEGENDVAVYLVDLDGVCLGRRPHARRRAADLARLAAGLAAHPWVTPAICRRFLRAYVRGIPAGSDRLEAFMARHRPRARRARAGGSVGKGGNVVETRMGTGDSTPERSNPRFRRGRSPRVS